MKRILFSLAAAFAAVMLTASMANAVTNTFDENAYPSNALNGFGGFTFGGMGVPGAVTVGSSSITIDANSFGGFGVDFLVEDSPGSGTFIPQDFDANTHRWEMRVKLLPDNVASVIKSVLLDDDGAGTADEHQYDFDLSSIPNDGSFHSIFVDLDAFVFSQPAFGFTAGDAVVNPGLRQIQLQSAFGSTDRLNVEVDFVRIAAIPEPASICLAIFGCAGVAAISRRRVR